MGNVDSRVGNENSREIKMKNFRTTYKGSITRAEKEKLNAAAAARYYYHVSELRVHYEVSVAGEYPVSGMYRDGLRICFARNRPPER